MDSRPPPVISQPTPLTSNKADPNPTNPAQYRYQSAIEDPTIAHTLLDRSLDAPIHTTTHELLATSGDLCKQFKEMIMSHRVNTNAVLVDSPTPIQSVDSFLNQHSDQYIAEYSLPLRVVFPEFENGVLPECILDGGAQVIVMWRDIWECLDLPLLTKKIMIMESANNMPNHTLEVVQNIKMTFKPIMLMLQIQVIEDAIEHKSDALAGQYRSVVQSQRQIYCYNN
jgi:hypothetical protein